MKKDSENFEAWLQIMKLIFERGGSRTQKMDIVQAVMTRYPRFSQGYERYASLLIEEGKLEPALEIYQKLIRDFQDQANYYMGMAHIYYNLGRLAEMRKSVKEAVGLDSALAYHPEVKKLEL